MSKKSKENDDLKGTLYMTFGVGIVIVIVWAYCFSLFIDRM
jgi:hypothetical protein